MTGEPRVTLHVLLIFRAFLSIPGREMYGNEIIKASGLASGTVYPILARMHEAGWATRREENVNPSAAWRPARRYYKLTPRGISVAREASSKLAALGVP